MHIDYLLFNLEQFECHYMSGKNYTKTLEKLTLTYE